MSGSSSRHVSPGGANGLAGLLPRWGWNALFLCLLFVLLQSLGDDARRLLRLDREALAQGQWWRLLTAHFVHLGWTHMALNATGVVLCGMLAPERYGRGFWVRVLGLSVGVGACLWLWSPQVADYVGFSGALYGLFVIGLLPQAWSGDRGAAVVLAGITGWMLWQWGVGPAQSEEHMIGGNIISVAHVYGYLLGLCLCAVGWVRTGAGGNPDSHYNCSIPFSRRVAMRYVVWLVRLLVFVLVLMFALNNTGLVDVRFYGDYFVTGVPLIVVMLSVFVLGTVFGLLLAASAVLRRGREVKRLKREVARLEDEIRYPAGVNRPDAPETVAPLAPL